MRLNHLCIAVPHSRRSLVRSAHFFVSFVYLLRPLRQASVVVTIGPNSKDP